MNFIEELKWRGMLHDSTPEVAKLLENEICTAYVGIDPTADSLHIGHLVGIVMLKHFQLAGHKPIALVGGATGMIGDPSGKSQERNLLQEETLLHNIECIKKQLSLFLDFNSNIENKAELVNNYDWMKNFSFLEFIRDIGKHLTVNYMMAKDSVKKRLDVSSKVGMSFTEFSYQLVQAYDFLWLFKNMGCKIQMGGSDQWGNITSGTELIRKKLAKEAYAITCPLITKADGTKFGKTEEGNVWLDPKLTSPYKFYQFWINTSDSDAEKYIKIFTFLSKEEIESLIELHKQEPHKRLLQSKLAQQLTVMVHTQVDYEASVAASQILFGKGTKETLSKIDERTFLSVFEGVPSFEINSGHLNKEVNILDLLAVDTQIFSSKAECRRLIKDNGLSINQEKIADFELNIDSSFLINNKYMLVRKGKKNYFLITVI